MIKNSRLVYSTDQGRIKPSKAKPVKGKPPEEHSPNTSGDGIVRIRREVNGRKGKGVTTITGLPMDEKDMKQLAKQLKQLCGTGGSVKNGIVEIQGDHREKIKTELEQQGHTVKLAGG